MNRYRIDDLEFTPSRFWCLHFKEFETIETSYRRLVGVKTGQFESLIKNLENRFQSTNTSFEHSERASEKRRWRPSFLRTKVLDWLMQNGGLKKSKAISIIDSFPIPVAPLMCHNAMNPLQFLGMAATIAKNPEVIVFQTSGMDPMGIALLQEYAAKEFHHGCLVHISTLPMGKGRCSSNSSCVTIE